MLWWRMFFGGKWRIVKPFPLKSIEVKVKGAMFTVPSEIIPLLFQSARHVFNAVLVKKKPHNLDYNRNMYY